MAAGGTEAEWNIGCAGCGNNSKGPITLLKQLQTDTAGWTANGIDIITATDIAKVTNNSTWIAGGNSFYFNTNTTTPSDTCKNGNTSGCKYGWLYDRTSSSCETYGCLNNSTGPATYGYWTREADSTIANNVWYTFENDYIGSYSIHAGIFGVRPVITISKSNIK